HPNAPFGASLAGHVKCHDAEFRGEALVVAIRKPELGVVREHLAYRDARAIRAADLRAHDTPDGRCQDLYANRAGEVNVERLYLGRELHVDMPWQTGTEEPAPGRDEPVGLGLLVSERQAGGRERPSLPRQHELVDSDPWHVTVGEKAEFLEQRGL